MKKSFALYLLFFCFALLNAADREPIFRSPFLKGAVPVYSRLEILTSQPGKPEKFKTVSPAEIKVKLEKSVRKLPMEAMEYYFKATNNDSKRLFLRPVFEAGVPSGKTKFFNGYQDTRKLVFDPNDAVLSNWFPTNAAYDKSSALIIGMNPKMLYSRIDSGRTKDKSGKVKLFLSTPFTLAPGESFDYSFVVSASSSRYGHKDVVQHWYDLFPKLFGPADKIDKAVLSGESSYLFWKPQALKQENTSDLIRRLFGGRGSWEWCYKPFIRMGDWSITEKWSIGFKNYRTKKQIDAIRERTRKRLAPAEFQGVAPMWYLNVCWTEWDLWKKHFPKISNEKNPRKRKCQGQYAIYPVYSWGNDYAKLFIESINRIPGQFPASKGIGWDSCFAHRLIPADVGGVMNTKRKSFKDGKIFALEAAGIANLLDINHRNFCGKYRMANAVNFKLVTPYMIGVRADAGLYEGNPMRTSDRLFRFETMVARLGTGKAIVWHKGADPKYIRWVDWEDMDAEEAQDVYRQLMENNLFLSYYWSGVPGPMLPILGNKILFERVPELIGLVRLGRQPSPGIDASGNLLVTRYGKGAGSRIVVINPEFKPVTAKLVFRPGYWNNSAVLAAREDGEPLESIITLAGAGTKFKIPARKIVILRVCGTGTLADSGIKKLLVKSEMVKNTGKPPYWRFKIMTHDLINLPVIFQRSEPETRVRIRINDNSQTFTNGKPSQVVLNSKSWPDDVQAGNRRAGNIEFREYPLYDVSALTSNDIKELDLIKAVKAQKLVVELPDNAPKAVKDDAKRIQDWFNYYTGKATGGKAAQPSVVAKAQADQTVIKLTTGNGAKIKKWQKARAHRKDKTIRIDAANPEALHKTVLAFLNKMDKLYPYYGVLPDTKGFKSIGLAGKVLEPAKAKKVFHPTLLEMMKKVGLK